MAKKNKKNTDKGTWRLVGKKDNAENDTVAPPEQAASEKNEEAVEEKVSEVKEEEQKVVAEAPIPVASVETTEVKTTVPTPAVAPKVVKIAETIKEYEVNKMETSSVTKTQTTGRGRYSNTGAAGTARVERGATAGADKSRIASRRSGTRDLTSGMEILDVEFLLTMVENFDSDTEQDMTLRRLSLNEIVRTQRIHEIDSNALKVYAMDEEGLYGKEVQVEAFKELTERTLSSGKV